MAELEQLQRDRSNQRDELQVRKDRLTAEEGALTKRYYAVRASVAEHEKALAAAQAEGQRHSEVEAALSAVTERTAAADRQRDELSGALEAVMREAAAADLRLNALRADTDMQRASSEVRLGDLRCDRDGLLKVLRQYYYYVFMVHIEK
jgi:hypothetical protein